MRFHKLTSILFIAVLALASCSKNGASDGKKTAATPARIICLSPSEAETVCALGAESLIVARTDFCDYPESLSSVPSIGGFDGKTISAETLLACKPDLILGSRGMHDQLSEQMKGFGIEFRLSDPKNIEDVKSEILQLAEILGRTEEGRNLVSKISARIDSVKTDSSVKEPVKAYYEVWNQPFMTAGKNAFITSVMEAAGFENIFSDQENPWPSVSEESIIARKPQVIFIPDQNGISVQDVAARTGWNQIPAVAEGRIFLVNSDILSRPGPRVADAVTELGGLLTSK